MGEISQNYKIKLICGVLFNPEWCMENFKIKNLNEVINQINFILEKELKNFGLDKIDLISSIIEFNFSDYYSEEMGKNLLRYWLSFSPNIIARNLYGIKIFTNELEVKYFSDNLKNRKVNLDPGFIEASKLVLFSTKNYSHRIYLEGGIFAEVTLIYKQKQFQVLDWTYPDYKTSEAIDFFTKVRQKFLSS
ncbi:MAG: DUF4416 family protein [Endomicrobiia bacterium]